jgi:hypothetical protein
VLVRGQPLAQDRLDRLPERLRHPRLAVRGQEPLHPTRPQAVGQRVPAVEATLEILRVERRSDQHERRRPLRVLQREPHDRVRAHRRARQHRPVDAAVVEHGQQVAGQRVVAVAVGGVRAPVPTRVVHHHAMPVALEVPGSHHHVPARRGQPVEQHHRDALARLLPGQAVDLELAHGSLFS